MLANVCKGYPAPRAPAFATRLVPHMEPDLGRTALAGGNRPRAEIQRGAAAGLDWSRALGYRSLQTIALLFDGGSDDECGLDRDGSHGACARLAAAVRGT